MLHSQSDWVVLLPVLSHQYRSLERGFEDKQQTDGRGRQRQRPRWLLSRGLAYKHPQLNDTNG